MPRILSNDAVLNLKASHISGFYRLPTHNPIPQLKFKGDTRKAEKTKDSPE